MKAFYAALVIAVVTSANEVRSYWMKQGFDLKKELWLVEFEVDKSHR